MIFAKRDLVLVVIPKTATTTILVLMIPAIITVVSAYIQIIMLLVPTMMLVPAWIFAKTGHVLLATRETVMTEIYVLTILAIVSPGYAITPTIPLLVLTTMLVLWTMFATTDIAKPVPSKIVTITIPVPLITVITTESVSTRIIMQLVMMVMLVHTQTLVLEDIVSPDRL